MDDPDDFKLVRHSWAIPFTSEELDAMIKPKPTLWLRLRRWLHERFWATYWDQVIAASVAFVLGTFGGAFLGGWVGAPFDLILLGAVIYGAVLGVAAAVYVWRLGE